ncbi:MAG: M14 family metallopeptidase [Bacteroidota bacterium]
MKKVAFFICYIFSTLFAQLPSKYHSNDEVTSALKQFAKQYSSLISIESISRTVKGNDLWVVTIGKKEPQNHKAILVVGGIEAASLAGTEHALRYIQHLASSYGKVDSITRLLDNTTVYVVPRANPDASESYFTVPLTERESDYSPMDDDRDALVDEDDVDDVNKDGIISWMRIEDPRGEWVINPDDARLMKKADPGKGEKGKYRLLSEGFDNDKDEEWNEDPAGGTDFNRNFTYNYQFFGKNSGVHQISEDATRALANFVFDRPNIAMLFTFSSNDNLTTAWKNEPPKGESSVISSVLKDDEDYYSFISKKFGEITKLKDAPKPVKGEGAFSEWGYYHSGRWSFAVRPWWPGEIPKVKDTAAIKDTTIKTGEGKKEEKDKTEDPQMKTLKWYDAIGASDVAVSWKVFSHPDFPGQTVEIGGIKPFRLTNPPAESLNAVAVPYVNFLTVLPSLLPSLSVENHKVEKIGENVFRVSVDVVNNGYLPTNSGIAQKTRWIRNVRVTLNAGNKNVVTSGKAKQVLNPIKGSGGFKTVSWIIVGHGSVTVSADSPIAGMSELKIDLQ